MRWEDEPWRKLYTRDTAAWACLDWQAQAVVLMFIRTCEADGTIHAPRGAEQIARFWRGWPVEVVAAGLEQLEADGAIVRHGGAYCMPNFVDAQASRTSAKARKARERAQARGIEAAQSRDAHCNSVTRGHTESHAVTKERKKERKIERTTAPPTTGQSPITHRALNAPWAEVREVLEACGRDLDRRTTWPLTEPAGFYEALRGAGGVEAVSEALRAVCERIKIQHIEAERWHNRMFSPGAWAALMAQLDQCVNADLQRKRRHQAALAVVPEPDKPDIDPEAAARIDAAIDSMFGGAK